MRLVSTSVLGSRLVVWLVAVCGFVVGGSVASAVAAPKNVLILTEGPIMPYVVLLSESLIAALRSDGAEPLNVFEESIDRFMFDSAEYDRQLVRLYKTMYGDGKLDLVITITEPALDFALRHRAELFPDAALLFGAVDERVIRSRKLGAKVTGLISHLDALATVETALALHPDTRNVVVVGGASRSDHGNVDVVKEDLRGLASRAAVTYIMDKSLNQVLAAVAALHDDAIVLFVSMQADGDGLARSGPEVLAALRTVSRAPIYGLSKNFLGHGILGGLLLDQQRHGTELGQRARQILAGAKVTDLQRMRTSNYLAFDWHELKRFGIDEARLPAGAAVVNREPGFWEMYKWTALVTSAVLLGQSLLIGGLLLQRQRRRRAERALRDLSGRLLSAQEDERRRIARELHDSLSQQMALLAIGIAQVVKKVGDAPEAVARAMRELGQRTMEISSEIHNLSHRLHSSKLEALGLAAAIRGHCHEVLAQGVATQFHEENVPDALPHEVALCFFRIVQEALNNVVKHSGAREAHVTLRAKSGALVLSVTDAGRGFDQNIAARKDGLGLASMHERLRLINGEFTVRSQPGHGTTITARAPIPKKERQPADARVA